jgi:hypothetical protein
MLAASHLAPKAHPTLEQIDNTNSASRQIGHIGSAFSVFHLHLAQVDRN